MVLKELIFNSDLLHWEEGVVVLKELIIQQFLLWNSVLILKELICNGFYVGMVWWS